MGCAMGTIRYIIFFFNFLLALAGLGIVILGVLTAHFDDGTTFKDVLHGQLSTPAIVLAIVGGCVFLFAFFGCCGALRESHCMVITYAVLLLTLFLLQVAVAVLAFTYKAQTQDAIGTALDKAYADYGKTNGTKQWIDGMQQELHCCGSYNNTTPWKDNRPDSCMEKGSTTPYADGCIPTAVNLVMDKLADIGHVAIGIGVIEVIGIVFSLCLANSIRRSELRGYA